MCSVEKLWDEVNEDSVVASTEVEFGSSVVGPVGKMFVGSIVTVELIYVDPMSGLSVVSSTVVLSSDGAVTSELVRLSVVTGTLVASV